MELEPGGMAKEMTVTRANEILDRIEPASQMVELRLAVARETLADIVHYETQMKASMKRLRSAVAASSQVGKFDEHTWGISVSAISVVPSPAGGQGRLEQRQITLPYRSRSPNPN